MRGGEIYVKKIPSMNIMDIAEAVAPGCKTEVVGVRAGEKLHEQMISSEDAEFTYEYEEYYKILPFSVARQNENRAFRGGVKVSPGFSYRSDTNNQTLSKEDLQKWVKLNYEALVGR